MNKKDFLNKIKNIWPQHYNKYDYSLVPDNFFL